MAYRAPPGIFPAAPSSLPARPPAPAGANGFKPSFNNSSAAASPSLPSAGPAQYGPASHYTTASHYGAAANQYASGAPGQFPGAPSYPGAPGSGVSSGAKNSSYLHQGQNQPQSYGAQATGYGASSSYPVVPQIQNPFPVPGTGYDFTEAAQIAEWQSAYNAVPQIGKDGRPIVAGPMTADGSRLDAAASAAAAAAATAHPDKKKTVVRSGGGKSWTDDTLLDWDPSHMRIFVGNLAGETTDESLFKAFSRWKSVQKARVIRDKRSTKSKGYGFVSFSDADDFFQAAKEMNGKYIQSHPVVVRKANTDIKATAARERGHHGKNKHKDKGKKNKANSGGQAGASSGKFEPSLGPKPGAGIVKPGQKTKNGLRLLG